MDGKKETEIKQKDREARKFKYTQRIERKIARLYHIKIDICLHNNKIKISYQNHF